LRLSRASTQINIRWEAGLAVEWEAEWAVLLRESTFSAITPPTIR